MTTYVNPFTGQTTSPTPSSYSEIFLTYELISPNDGYFVQLQWPINGTGVNAAILSNINDITAINTQNIALPSAQQVSEGQSFVIRNVGAVNITVHSFNNQSTLLTIAPGKAEYIYLTSNATDAGSWTSVTLGAGVSTASAGSLVFADLFGIQALGTLLAQQYPVTTFYSDASLGYYSRAYLNIWGGGVGTFSLLSASNSEIGYGWFCMIRNGGTGILTVLPDGTNTIDGESTLQLQLGESVTIVSDGLNWHTFGIGRSNEFAYTQLSLTVTGGTLVLSSTQAANTIQQYSGTLASNQIIQVPPTVQLYSVTNSTEGSYTLTVTTGGVGYSTVEVAQGVSLILICDGHNIYNAASGGASSTITTLTLGNGSVGIPSLRFVGDTTTGLFLPSSGTLGIAVLGDYRAFFDAFGLTVNGEVTASGGISGGTF